MKQFKDNADRNWTIAINVDAVKRLRDLTAVDILDVKTLEILLGDFVKLVDVLYVVCKEQADALGISDVQFGQSMGGDAIEIATNALIEEIVNFFPPSRRQVWKAAIEKIKAYDLKATAMVLEKINSPEMDQLLNQTLGDLSGSSPASLASTPAPSLSAS